MPNIDYFYMLCFFIPLGYSPFETISSSPLSSSIHSKGSLTASYSEHCPQSLPPFTGRYGSKSRESLVTTKKGLSKGFQRVKNDVFIISDDITISVCRVNPGTGTKFLAKETTHFVLLLICFQFFIHVVTVSLLQCCQIDFEFKIGNTDWVLLLRSIIFGINTMSQI